MKLELKEQIQWKAKNQTVWVGELAGTKVATIAQNPPGYVLTMFGHDSGTAHQTLQVAQRIAAETIINWGNAFFKIV